MGFRVIWSDQAITDLHDICSFIAQQDPQAAERMGKGILDHVHILSLLVAPEPGVKAEEPGR